MPLATTVNSDKFIPCSVLKSFVLLCSYSIRSVTNLDFMNLSLGSSLILANLGLEFLIRCSL